MMWLDKALMSLQMILLWVSVRRECLSELEASSEYSVHDAERVTEVH